MDVSENSGSPKSSILIRSSSINHPFWGTTIFGNTHINPLNIYIGCTLPNSKTSNAKSGGFVSKNLVIFCLGERHPAATVTKLSLSCIMEVIRNGKIRQHLLGISLYHHKCRLIWKINPLDAISCLFFQNGVQAILHKRQETLGASDKLMFA